MSTFISGLRYPWAKPGRLWNVLWFLVPIIGWFALLGYVVRIVQALNKGHVKELPNNKSQKHMNFVAPC
jgi:hypothetical protein